MHRGYIKIWRKLEDSGLLQMHETLATMIFLILHATHKDVKRGTKYGVVDLKRGQGILALRTLAKDMQLSVQSIRTILVRLEKMEILTLNPTHAFSVYTIVNYNKYNDISEQPARESTNEQHAANTPPTQEQALKHLSIKEETKPTSAKSAISIKTFLANCEASGERRIPETDSVFEFAETTGISLDMVKVCWNHFVEMHLQSGKRQKDWRGTFRNCVKSNWYKLWFIEADGTVKETSQYRALKKGQKDV